MNYKILIIEDEQLIAKDLSNKLKRLGYQVVGIASNFEEAAKVIRDYHPDLIICDIMLENEDMDGIDLIHEIYAFYKVPVIYLTANSESVTVKRAMQTHPAAFLLKPFRVSEFSINIDMAIENFRSTFTMEKANKLANDALFLPDNYTYIRVEKPEISHVEADSGYIIVHTRSKKYSLSMNLNHFWDQLADDSFLKVSRSFIINSKFVHTINGNMLYLDGRTPGIKISRSQRQEILKRFPILKTK